MTQYSSGSGGSSGGSSVNDKKKDFLNRDYDENQTKRPSANLNGEEKLMVAVRIRPLKSEDGGTRVLHAINDKMVVIEEIDGSDKVVVGDVIRQNKRGKNNSRQYIYDIAFGEDSSQESVYNGTTKALVDDVINGYNGTVFAYGPTGAGKTHTMVGSSSEPGIMVRALNDIFLAAEKLADNIEFAVTMSYLEIYNENIRDLLNPSSGYLELREDSRGRNIKVSGLSEISTNSTEEVMQLLHKGNRARTVEPTAANKTSSRSHALLSVMVRQSHPIEEGDRPRTRLKHGRLFMIDLAGSERAKQTKNQGKRLQEGAHINRSLLALGNCINALSGGARYVNYRDSKLTRLLKEALSGNCRTVMIAHVSPSSSQRDESKNTLVYADRANRISNKVERNVLDVSYHVSQYRNIISDLKNEISRLRNKMESNEGRLSTTTTTATTRTNDAAASSSSSSSSDVVVVGGGGKKDTSGNLKNLREKIVSNFREQMRLRRKIMELDSHLLGLKIASEQQHAIISQWESRNNKLYKNTRDIATVNSSRSRIEKYDDDEIDFLEEIENDAAMQHAWAELAEINREQERYSELRSAADRELDNCRQRSLILEDELPSRISSDEERELLALMLRVQELEADKMMLQSERLVKQHELRRRELVILRYDRQRQISEEIITRQRQLMEDGRLPLPIDLQELYSIYQQEIHATSYPETNLNDRLNTSGKSFTKKLPPISTRFPFDSANADYRGNTSSTESENWENPNFLPEIEEPITTKDINRIMGPTVHPLISTAAIFPPISAANIRRRNSEKKLRRTSSENSMSTGNYPAVLQFDENTNA